MSKKDNKFNKKYDPDEDEGWTDPKMISRKQKRERQRERKRERLLKRDRGEYK